MLWQQYEAHVQWPFASPVQAKGGAGQLTAGLSHISPSLVHAVLASESDAEESS